MEIIRHDYVHILLINCRRRVLNGFACLKRVEKRNGFLRSVDRRRKLFYTIHGRPPQHMSEISFHVDLVVNSQRNAKIFSLKKCEKFG